MISSSYLFHFTDTRAKMESILENGFRVSYSLEDFAFLQNLVEIDFDRFWSEMAGQEPEEVSESKDKPSQSFQLGIPMTCFCDIPLALVLNHTETYGRYAIGFAKDWGIQRGMGPINYIAHGSDIAATIQTFDALTKRICTSSDNYIYRNIFFKILRFTKPYEGVLKKGDLRRNRYRFYDEREWRFVEKNDFTPLHTKESLAHLDTWVVRHLPFDMDDVRFLLVDNPSEVSELKEMLRHKGEKEALEATRIGTVEMASAEEWDAA